MSLRPSDSRCAPVSALEVHSACRKLGQEVWVEVRDVRARWAVGRALLKPEVSRKFKHPPPPGNAKKIHTSLALFLRLGWRDQRRMWAPVLARGMGATGPGAQVCQEGLSAKPAPRRRVPLIYQSQLDQQMKTNLPVPVMNANGGLRPCEQACRLPLALPHFIMWLSEGGTPLL